ncbi:MAG TPA: hypothetical protein PLZ45_14020, partial [Ferruginibacter sp.]|nr:hypothetical protein [Ferruginibacter sp.]
MRKQFDVMIIGAGPTALALYKHYARTNRSLRIALLIEQNCGEGAYSKGVKVANSIVPKLPQLKAKDRNKY